MLIFLFAILLLKHGTTHQNMEQRFYKQMFRHGIFMYQDVFQVNF